MVIASRESQYKILHFHHGGLDKLAEIFEDWNLFAKMKDKVCSNTRNVVESFVVLVVIVPDFDVFSFTGK